jgi:hypothetical protein
MNANMYIYVNNRDYSLSYQRVRGDKETSKALTGQQAMGAVLMMIC